MKVLFVCLGNICRSPTAEAVCRKHFALKKISVEFDSAGTADYHVGEKSDHRTIKHGEARGYVMDHRARQFKVNDFHDFDLIFAMDKANLKNIKALCPDPRLMSKVHLMLETAEVPDPYYKGPEAFEEVIDLLENSVEKIIKKFFTNS